MDESGPASSGSPSPGPTRPTTCDTAGRPPNPSPFVQTGPEAVIMTTTRESPTRRGNKTNVKYQNRACDGIRGDGRWRRSTYPLFARTHTRLCPSVLESGRSA
ncbi:unnamed protein product [Protopolystoma xenopodis]|uniref:Uncharacterized protein n=1 Tax=Protopolystoma xenopodis TaxID=117903 RepID=A0A3S5FDX7_9PLAT|nr:unnamed protein product [Protopolystoma xenopodis]